jgi:glycosyltransferase involved in cell wall biosynthesis
MRYSHAELMAVRSARLRILYVGTLPPHPGGTAVACSQILLGLASLGHSVRSIAPITPEALDSGDSFAIAAPHLGVHRYTVPYFDVDSPNTPPSYRQTEGAGVESLFAEIVAGQRPDVVIAGRESFARQIPKLAAAEELPCVVIAHGSHWIPVLRRSEGRSSDGMLGELRRADRVVTPARHLAEALQALGVEAIQVIPNPVDLERFQPRPPDLELACSLGIQEGDLVVMHASNLKPIKRPLDIVDSARRVLAEQPGVLYLIVGEGRCRPEMEAACLASGISAHFRFVGWVDHERMPDYLNLADIVLMTSKSEAQSCVMLESQAAGRLLLASDNPGAREVVADGKSGILFGVGDVDELAAKTLWLASRPDLRRRIGDQARTHVRRHSLPEAVLAYEDVLQELVTAGTH